MRLPIDDRRVAGGVSTPPDLGNGFYSVWVDGIQATRNELTFDERARTFVVKDDLCKGRVESFEVYFQMILTTVHE